MIQSSPYVLFADDDPDDLELLIPAFVKENPGVRASMVTSGEELFEWLHNCPRPEYPSLILIDYKLGNTTAAEVLRALNEKGHFQRHS